MRLSKARQKQQGGHTAAVRSGKVHKGGGICTEFARGDRVRGLRQKVRDESMGRLNLEVLGTGWFGEVEDMI